MQASPFSISAESDANRDPSRVQAKSPISRTRLSNSPHQSPQNPANQSKMLSLTSNILLALAKRLCVKLPLLLLLDPPRILLSHLHPDDSESQEPDKRVGRRHNSYGLDALGLGRRCFARGGRGEDGECRGCGGLGDCEWGNGRSIRARVSD